MCVCCYFIISLSHYRLIDLSQQRHSREYLPVHTAIIPNHTGRGDTGGPAAIVD